MRTFRAIVACGVSFCLSLLSLGSPASVEATSVLAEPPRPTDYQEAEAVWLLPTFTDITVSAGVGDWSFSTGCAFGDMDNDGDLDLYVSNIGLPNRLFENLGSNIFTDIAASAGVVLGDRGCIFGDTDNDGDLDLFVASVWDTNRLYRNEGGGSFTDISGSAGCGYALWSFAPIWGDIDNDGLIDLFLANDEGENRLYRNDGNNTFTDVTGWAGVGGSSGSYQGIFGDIDGDADLDLYVVHRYSAYNSLYENDGSGRFTDVTWSAGVPGTFDNDQGTVFGDYDNDGDLDIFIAYCGASNMLYQNDGAGHFVDVASAAGVADSRESISVAFGDLDNDGHLDLYVGNACQPNVLYRNNGDGTFTDISGSAGVGDPGRNIGMALGDIEDDGDLDIYVTNSDEGNVMYRNNMDNCDFLKVRLVGTVSNRYGIGSKVIVYEHGHAGDPGYLVGFREVHAGSGIWSMDALERHFGVKEDSLYDVRAIFPSGIVVDSLNLAACQTITIIETQATGTISGGKFYDSNVNGFWDAGEAGLADWLILLESGDSVLSYSEIGRPAGSYGSPRAGPSRLAYTFPDGGAISLLSVDSTRTDTSGHYGFLDLEPGMYTVGEVVPAPQPVWVPTTPTQYSVAVQPGQNVTGIDFGNVALGEIGARTIGYWKNHLERITPGMYAALDVLPAFVGCGNPDSVLAILRAPWPDMAAKLRAQLLAMTLNVLSGIVPGDAIVCLVDDVLAAGLLFGVPVPLFKSAQDILDAVEAAYDWSGWSRSEQEAVKDLLDRMNNDLLFALPDPPERDGSPPGMFGGASMAGEYEVLPRSCQLFENHPNPFGAGGTTISFNVTRSTLNVSLKVYDLRGKLVRTLVDRRRRQGVHRLTWDGKTDDASAVPNGVYLCYMKAGTDIITRKMVLLR